MKPRLLLLLKTRVALVKTFSILKLALRPAILASLLRIKLETHFLMKVENFSMWTDFTTVLQWLISTSKLPVFAASRVSKNLEFTTNDEWCQVYSNGNQADRGNR